MVYIAKGYLIESGKYIDLFVNSLDIEIVCRVINELDNGLSIKISQYTLFLYTTSLNKEIYNYDFSNVLCICNGKVYSNLEEFRKRFKWPKTSKYKLNWKNGVYGWN